MVLGIASLVEGRLGETNRTAVWSAHLAGAALGGFATAAGAWVVATPLRTFVPASGLTLLLLAVVALALLMDLKLLRIPSAGRQVPSWWTKRFGYRRSFFFFGFLLGAGVWTRVHYALVYVWLAAASVVRSPASAALLGLAFGLSRAILVGPAALAPDLSSRILYRSPQSARWWPRLSLSAGLVVGAALASSLLA